MMIVFRHPISSTFSCEPVRKDRRADISEIERLARKIEPGLFRAILRALQDQQDAVNLRALIEALKSGSTANVLSVLESSIGSAGKAATEQALMNGAAAAGAVTAKTIARITRADFHFSVLNPGLIDWLKTYSFGLIQQIDNTTREAVREAVIYGMKAGKNPVDTAREIKQVVGLTDRQAKAVANYRRQLETFHLKRFAGGFGLGKPIDRVNGRQVFRPGEDGTPLDGIDQRRLRDFRYDGQLQTAMTTGKPLSKAQIDKMVDAYQRKYLKYRAETIARTESLRATNIGIQNSWKQAIEQGTVPEALVRRQWIVAKDERLCSHCAPIPGLNPKQGVPFGQPFRTPTGPATLPPLHPNCRCTVFLRLYEPSQLGPGPSG